MKQTRAASTSAAAGTGAMRQFVMLVAFKALAELRSERQRTYLGFLWWFFEPAFYMLVFYFVFAVLIDRGGPDYVAVLLSGLVLWQWFNNTIMHCSTSIRASMSLLRSVPIQIAVLPLSVFLADSIKFTMVLVVLFIVLIAMGHPPTIAWLAFPAVLAVELLWASGCSLFVAAIVPFVPDLRFVIAPLLQGLFFVSGIFFTLDSLTPDMRQMMELNPMAVIIDVARQILLHGEFPDPWRLVRVGLGGLVVLAIGVLTLTSFARRYPKLAD